MLSLIFSVCLLFVAYVVAVAIGQGLVDLVCLLACLVGSMIFSRGK